MAVFCLSTLFVGCDNACTPHADENADLTCDNCGEALEAPACKPHADADNNYVCDNCSGALTVPCETHKDANSDKLCDDCGLAVVTITQLVPPTAEERVDMVVNPLPENANPGEFLDKTETLDVLTSATKLEGNYVDSNDVYGYYTIDAVNTLGVNYKKHVVINIVTGETVYEIVDLYEGILTGGTKTVNISLNPYYFTVTATVSGINDVMEPVSTTTVYSYMSYNGDVLYNVVEKHQDITEWTAPSIETVNSVVYITFNNTVYAFDAYDTEVIATLDKMTLVYRPEFDYVNGNYGYVYLDSAETVFVYDLTKWVECVYSFAVPSYYENISSYYINNGNLLIQACVRLADNAISYDVIEFGGKYDIVYIIVNPAAKTATEVEFGYYINYAGASDKNADWNEIAAYPVVNDRIDYNHELYLTTDKDLNILFNDIYDDATVVADNIILVTEEISDGLFVNKLINNDGEFIAYVPVNAIICDNYIVYDDKLYNFSMQEVLDPAKNGYTVNAAHENYLILTKQTPSVEDPSIIVTEHYYYSIANNEAVKSTLENYYLVSSNELFYVIQNAVASIDSLTGTAVTQTVYSVFNCMGELVFTANHNVYDFSEIADGVYAFYLTDGSIYIVK